MKIAAVKKFTQVLVAMAVAAVMAALLCAPKALGTTIGEFSIEQIYVNVPELDVFVQATDAQGQPISPDLVRAAGVELYLGDEKIPTADLLCTGGGQQCGRNHAERIPHCAAAADQRQRRKGPDYAVYPGRGCSLRSAREH